MDRNHVKTQYKYDINRRHDWSTIRGGSLRGHRLLFRVANASPMGNADSFASAAMYYAGGHGRRKSM